MSSNNYVHDYVILGAGPAGLQLGYYFEQSKLDYIIIESGSGVGTSFKTFPRHRTLISINKVHTGFDDSEINLRWDWNSLLNDEDLLFKEFNQDYFPNADSLVDYLEQYASKFGMNIDFNQEVTNISRESDDGLFALHTAGEATYKCKILIIATGFRKPNQPNIPGMELTECYSNVSVDPKDYINQEVLIVGKGNSAFEMADSLIPSAAVIHVISPKVLQFAWETHYVGHLRAINNNFLDTYQLKSQNALLDGFVEGIEKKDGKYYVAVNYLHASGEREVLTYDKVINCTGFKFDNSLFDQNVRPSMCNRNKFPLQTNEWESTNVKDMYFAGTITHVRDYRKTTSGFIHGFRYNVKALHKILQYKYRHQPIVSREIDIDVDSIIEHSMARINRSSALWQQFGFLVDVIDMASIPRRGIYLEELPVDYVREVYLKDCDNYLTVSLEFGKVTGNPFAINRTPMPEQANKSVFLHPVFRQFRDGKLTSEFHLLEDLYGKWEDNKQHLVPLKNHLVGTLNELSITES